MNFPLLTHAPQILHARCAQPPAGLKLAPCPRGDFLTGHMKAAKETPLSFFPEMARRHGPVVRLHFGPLTAHLLVAPEHVQHVLQDHHKGFSKQVRGYDKLRTVLGNGLLNSEGDFWLRQRRLIQPLFDRRSLARFAAPMVRVAAETAGEWQAAAVRGATIDAGADMSRLTLRIVGHTLLGTDVAAEAKEVGEALPWLMRELNQRIFNILDFTESWPLPRNREFQRRLEVLDRAVYRIIEERRRHQGEADDLVTLLLRARDEETGGGMSDRQVRDEVMTFFLAGHETTANLLAWTWMLLAENPAAGRRLRGEIDAVLGDRELPEAADFPRLEYTQRLLQESMRLYPPAWFLERKSLEDQGIGGYFIPMGSVVMMAPWVTHRHPDHWPDPERFDPDRFLPESCAARPKWSWFPFGGGPRLCIGNHFAMLEAALVLAVLARRFHLEKAPDFNGEPDPSITLRPKHGLRMTVQPISAD